MDLNDFLKKQSDQMDQINKGEAKSIKEKEETMKSGSSKVKTNIPLEELVDLIKPDVLVGMDKYAIANLHKTEVGRVIKALDVLRYDKDVIEYKNKKLEEKQKKKKEKQHKKQQNTPVTVVKEDVKETLTPVKKSSKTINDDIKLAIASDYETGKFIQRELAVKYNVSDTTVYNVISDLISEEKREEIALAHYRERNKKIHEAKKANKKEVKKTEPPKKSMEEIVYEDEQKEKEEAAKKEEDIVVEKIDEKEVEVLDPVEAETNVIKSYTEHTFAPPATSQDSMYPSTDFIQDIIEVNTSTAYKTVGLINNRHNMGVHTYIYGSVPKNRVYDFDWLESQAEDFVKQNIKFNKNGIPTQGLIVKCTGLQSAIMSITKVCYNLKVNLIISHHQIEAGVDLKYNQQPIFTDFEVATDIPYSLSHISNTVSKLYLFKSKPAEYIDINTFFEINISNRDTKVREEKNPEKDKPLSTYSILAKNIEEAMIANALLSKHFITDRTYFRVSKLVEYDIDQSNSMGYSSKVLLTSQL